MRRVLSCVALVLVLAGCSSEESKPRFETRGVRQASGYCAIDPRTVADAEKIDDFSEGNGCGVRNAWRVSAIGGVALDGTKTMNCATIYAASRWLEEVVQPAAESAFGSRVTRINVPSTYACRPRNNVRGAKLSEHGMGNAIDISTFALNDGRSVNVEQGWFGRSDERRFLQTVRSEACGRFNTVLGPGSDAYHKNHIHLDLQQHRNGGTYCR